MHWQCTDCTDAHEGSLLGCTVPLSEGAARIMGKRADAFFDEGGISVFSNSAARSALTQQWQCRAHLLRMQPQQMPTS